MGIRIHKKLGYGLTDVKTVDYNIVDDRFNPNGMMCVSWEDREKWTIEGYKNWLVAKKDAICKEQNCKNLEDEIKHAFNYVMEINNITNLEESKESIDYCFTINEEFGIPQLLCITPYFHLNEWCRYDNIIDYVEEHLKQNLNKDEISYFKLISGGIYPYNFFWDSRNGKSVKDAYLYNTVISNEKEFATSVLSVEEWAIFKNKIAQQIGFEDYESCDKYLKPIVPASLMLICEYCEIFKDVNTVRELQPMLYVYWS